MGPPEIVIGSANRAAPSGCRHSGKGETTMRRMAMAISVLLLVASAALCLTSAASFSSPEGLTLQRGGGNTQCGTATCHSGTHCCFDCSGNPVCLKNGVMCPVCL